MSDTTTPITDRATWKARDFQSPGGSSAVVHASVCAKLERQRDQLLAALNRFDVEGLELEGDEEIDITMTAEDLRILRAAIAKAKGGSHE